MQKMIKNKIIDVETYIEKLEKENKELKSELDECTNSLRKNKILLNRVYGIYGATNRYEISPYKKVKSNVYLLRLKNNLTAKQLADKASVSRATIHNAENYIDTITIETLSKIAKALNCSVKDLFIVEGEDTNKQYSYNQLLDINNKLKWELDNLKDRYGHLVDKENRKWDN